MFRNKLLHSMILALVAAGLVACSGPGKTEGAAKTVTVDDEVGLLAFLNDTSFATFEVLDDACAIRSDSAKQIIKHRDGTRGNPQTNLFDSVEELLGVAMVGPWTVGRLAECAVRYGYSRGLDWFTAFEGDEPGTSNVALAAFDDGTAALLNRGIIFQSTGNVVVSRFRSCNVDGCSAPIRVDGGFPEYQSSYGTAVQGIFEHRLVALPAGNPSGAKAVLGVLGRYSGTYINSDGLLYALFLRTWDGANFGPWQRVTPVGIVGRTSLATDANGRVWFSWGSSNNIYPGDVNLSWFDPATGEVGPVERVDAATKVLGFQRINVVAAPSGDVWVTYEAPDGFFARRRSAAGQWDARISIANGGNGHSSTWADGTLWVAKDMSGSVNVYRLSNGAFQADKVGLFLGDYYESDTELEDTFYNNPSISPRPEGGVVVAVARIHHYENYGDSSLDFDVASTVVRERNGAGVWSKESTVFNATWNNVGGNTASTQDRVWIAGSDWDTLFLVRRDSEASNPDPDPEPPTPPTGVETESHTSDLSTVDAALVDVIWGAARQEAGSHMERTSPYDGQFAELITYYTDGEVTRYEVVYTQMLDPEGGIQLYVVVVLDPDYNVLSSYGYI